MYTTLLPFFSGSTPRFCKSTAHSLASSAAMVWSPFSPAPGPGRSFVRRAEHNVQNADHSLVQRGFAQGAGFNGGHDLGVIDTAGTGHFQVKPSRNTLYTVSYSAQSDITKPLKFHSVRRISVSSMRLSLANTSFTRL